jgi:general secretion pathway protein L
MQKIIALDIGSYSIKAIEFMNKFKTYEVSNIYEKILPHVEEPDPTLVSKHLKELFEENAIVADRIITAMPGQYISSRIMTFNFSDINKIEAAVYSEIEDLVPFNLDDMILDQQVLGTIDQRTFTLVVMTKKEFLGNFLETLKSIGIDPKLIDVDSLSFYNLSPFLAMEKGKVYGIVDIGHEKTSICLVQDNVLRMFRSINLGGRYITEFISRDMQVPYEEAQRLKHEVSTVLTEDYPMESMTPKELEISQITTLALKSIARELSRTLYAFKTWEKSPIEKIFLSGGTSQIKNLEHYMKTQLFLESVYMNLASTALPYNNNIAEHLPIMGQGISIGIRSVSSAKKHSQINLRKGDFAYIQDYATILNTASMISKIMSVALFLLCLGYGVKYFFYNREINSIREVYVKELATVNDSKKKIKTEGIPFAKIHKDTIAQMKTRMEQKAKSFDAFIAENADSGALISLQQISQSVPKTIKIDVVDYDYTTKPDGSGLLKLRVEADSFETIDQLKERLGSIKVFSGLNQKSSDTKPGADTKIAVLETNYNSHSAK